MVNLTGSEIWRPPTKKLRAQFLLNMTNWPFSWGLFFIHSIYQHKYVLWAYSLWMMINHSTLDYHVTNFNTLSRWLLRTNQTLTLYSDPNPYPNQNPNQNPNPDPNPNEKFYLLPYIDMSRDVTWQKQFFAYNFSGKHFNPTSCGVIRNQRSKIRRLNIMLTSEGPFRKILKFECRLI